MNAPDSMKSHEQNQQIDTWNFVGLECIKALTDGFLANKNAG